MFSIVRITRVHAAVGVLFAALASGCATPPPSPLSADAASHLHRIAVVSSVAQVFARHYTGLTMFGNEHEEIDISDWHVDAEYEAQLATELEKFPGITPVRVSANASDFQIDYTSRSRWEAIAPAAKALCTSQALDGVLVLGRSSTWDFLAGTNQSMRGAGFYVRGPGEGVAVLHVMAEMGLLDCKSGEPLALRELSRTQSGSPGVITQNVPYMRVSTEMAREPVAEWTEEHKQQIRADLITLPANAWGPTLRSIFPAGSGGR
jgi:hypothetical protein